MIHNHGHKYACPRCGSVNLHVVACTYAKLVQHCDGTIGLEPIPGAEMWESYHNFMRCADCGEEEDGASAFEAEQS